MARMTRTDSDTDSDGLGQRCFWPTVAGRRQQTQRRCYDASCPMPPSALNLKDQARPGIASLHGGDGGWSSRAREGTYSTTTTSGGRREELGSHRELDDPSTLFDGLNQTNRR
jgi:hypothetical protein